MIYGSDETSFNIMRHFEGGLLKSKAGDMLDASSTSECLIPQEIEKHCFHSGDRRVNEQPGLALYHIIWHR